MSCFVHRSATKIRTSPGNSAAPPWMNHAGLDVINGMYGPQLQSVPDVDVDVVLSLQNCSISSRALVDEIITIDTR